MSHALNYSSLPTIQDMTYQFYISLKDSSPFIWRRVCVPSSITFDDLHLVIQIVMPWENVHLYEFSVDREYGKDTIAPLEESELEDYVHRRKSKLNAETLTLESYLETEGTTFSYIYDFGDNWHHELILEKRERTGPHFPKCIEWRGIAPLEDCGGVPGFNQLLSILKDPLHPKYHETLEWADMERGEKFEEVYVFDLNEVNGILEEVFEE